MALVVDNTLNEKDFEMQGGSYTFAFKANGGTCEIQVKVEEGVYIPIEPAASTDFVKTADLGDAVCRFVVTGSGKLAVYGGINE